MRLNFRDVMLNWACAECISPRWRMKYDGIVTQETQNKIAFSPRFDGRTLPLNQQDALIACMKKYRASLIDSYLAATSNYTVERFVFDDIGNLKIMYEMHWQDAPMLLKEFACKPRDPLFVGDPRVVSDAICMKEGLIFSGMPIVVHLNNEQKSTLIEGYARSLAFLQKARSGDSINVIVCR